MTEHRVEITDSIGQSMKILIRLSAPRQGKWQTLDNGFLCYENGVADAGHYPTLPHAWVALYGGSEIDDSKLVLHLDDCQGPTGLNQKGKGLVYKKDYLLMQPGEVSWKLIG